MDILEIAKRIKDSGGKLYLVGGAVRNVFLNIEITDEDYCVVGLSKKDFINLFPEAKIRGKSFEVFDLYNKEFALARTENKIGFGHKNFEIIANKDITIEQDLERRDITINAIAQDVLTKQIIDPFDGVKDLKNKIIRATTNAFAEDPLRVYRVARFAAILQFNVEDNTLKLMKNLKSELYSLSKERVFMEFKKALNTNIPSIFFDILRQADVLDIHFQEIYNLINVPQPEEYHPEGDAYNHTMITLNNTANLTKDLEIRFSALVHDLGKGNTPKEIYPHHYGHEERGEKLVLSLSKRLNVPRSWIKCGIVSAKQHMRGGIFNKMSISKQVDFIEIISKTKLGLEGLQIIVNSDKNRMGKDIENKDIFVNLGNKILNEINGTYIQKKYKNLPEEKFREKLHQERVNLAIELYNENK